MKIISFISIANLAIALYVSTSNVWANDIVGKWKTLDDKTGSPGANVIIYRNNDGTFAGKIEKIYDLPNGTQQKVGKCTLCSGELKNKPIIGLRVLSNLVIDPENPNEYINAIVVDPETGKTYKGKAKLSSDGNKLTLRGYIGVSLLGRSQTWIRLRD